jgi:hypothetical protein
MAGWPIPRGTRSFEEADRASGLFAVESRIGEGLDEVDQQIRQLRVAKG